MRIVYVANSDRERFFSYLVRTIPFDSTGVFHIIEHTVLSGSEKYRCEDPFTELRKGSVSSYMNAFTALDYTGYPAASPLKKDFENIFDVYTDAVFRPLLRKSSFEREGVRYTGEAWDGVVYNEMKGAGADHEVALLKGVGRAMFPDSCYCFNSGGDPVEIPSLTYSDYLDTYKKFYNPSNISLFLYGDCDLERVCRVLDTGYLPKEKTGQRIGGDPVAAKPETDRIFRCSTAGENEISSLVVWRIGSSSDLLEIVTVNLVVELLLDSPSSPLYRRVLEAGLGRELSGESGVISGYPELLFAVGYKGFDLSGENRLSEEIIRMLRSIVECGFDAESVAGSIKRARFSERDLKTGMGMRTMHRLLMGRHEHKLFGMLEYDRALSLLESRIGEDPRYLEHWIEKRLIDNPVRAVVSAVSDPGFFDAWDIPGGGK